jgi:hypothetical protein
MIGMLLAAFPWTPVPIEKNVTWGEAYRTLTTCAVSQGSVGMECRGTYRGLNFQIFTDYGGEIKRPGSSTTWYLQCGVDPIQAQSICWITNRIRVYYIDGFFSHFDWNGIKAARIGTVAFPETNGARETPARSLQIISTMEKSDKMLLKDKALFSDETEYKELDLTQFSDALDFLNALAQAHARAVKE